MRRAGQHQGLDQFLDLLGLDRAAVDLAARPARSVAYTLAVQELLADQSVLASMTAFEQFLDKEKFSALDKE